MPLLEEMIDVGAIHSTQDADSALQKIAQAASAKSPTPPDLTDAELEALDDLKEQLADGFNCKKLRDFLHNLGVFGCARSRRIKAIAAVLNVPYDQIKDCLSKPKEEADEEYQSLIFLGPDPLNCDDPKFLDGQAGLRAFLCGAPPPEPKEGDFCPAPSSPFEPPSGDDIAPLPDTPTENEWIDACNTMSDSVTAATDSGNFLSPETIATYIRTINSAVRGPKGPGRRAHLGCLAQTINHIEEHETQAQRLIRDPDEKATLEALGTEAEEALKDEISIIAETSTWLNDFMEQPLQYGLPPHAKISLINAISAMLTRAIATGDEQVIAQVTEQLARAQTIGPANNLNPFAPEDLTSRFPYRVPYTDLPSEIWPLFDPENPVFEMEPGVEIKFHQERRRI